MPILDLQDIPWQRVSSICCRFARWPSELIILRPALAFLLRLIVKRIPELIRRAGIKDISSASQVQAITLPNNASILRVVVPFTTTKPEAKCQAVFKFVKLRNGDIKLFTTTSQLLEVGVAPWQDCVNTRPVSETLPEKTDVLVIGGG